MKLKAYASGLIQDVKICCQSAESLSNIRNTNVTQTTSISKSTVTLWCVTNTFLLLLLFSIIINKFHTYIVKTGY